MRISKFPLAMLAAASFSLAPALGTLAAPASKPLAPPPAQARPAIAAPMTADSHAKISDQKLGQAAAAMQHVIGVRQRYEKKIAKAAPGDRERIAGQSQAAIKKAVTDQGLSVDEYNKILVAAQKDPALRQKLLARLHTRAQ